jgi:hypothetical protein
MSYHRWVILLYRFFVVSFLCVVPLCHSVIVLFRLLCFAVLCLRAHLPCASVFCSTASVLVDSVLPYLLRLSTSLCTAVLCICDVTPQVISISCACCPSCICCAALLLSVATDVAVLLLEVGVEEGGWEEGCVDVAEVS